MKANVADFHSQQEAIVQRQQKLVRAGYKPKHLAVDEFAIHKGHKYDLPPKMTQFTQGTRKDREH